MVETLLIVTCLLALAALILSAITFTESIIQKSTVKSNFKSLADATNANTENIKQLDEGLVKTSKAVADLIDAIKKGAEAQTTKTSKVSKSK